MNRPRNGTRNSRFLFKHQLIKLKDKQNANDSTTKLFKKLNTDGREEILS